LIRRAFAPLRASAERFSDKLCGVDGLTGRFSAEDHSASLCSITLADHRLPRRLLALFLEESPELRWAFDDFFDLVAIRF